MTSALTIDGRLTLGSCFSGVHGVGIAAGELAAKLVSAAEYMTYSLAFPLVTEKRYADIAAGELAAEREKASMARPPTPAAGTIPARHGTRAPAAVLVTCASPSAKAKQQAMTAASPLAKQHRHAIGAAEHQKVRALPA